MKDFRVGFWTTEREGLEVMKCQADSIELLDARTVAMDGGRMGVSCDEGKEIAFICEGEENYIYTSEMFRWGTEDEVED